MGIDISDPMPGTILIELLLVGSAMPSRPALSLGVVKVPSTAKATLRLDIPPQTAIGGFDKFRIVIHVPEPRMDRSANVTLDDFNPALGHFVAADRSRRGGERRCSGARGGCDGVRRPNGVSCGRKERATLGCFNCGFEGRNFGRATVGAGRTQAC